MKKLFFFFSFSSLLFAQEPLDHVPVGSRPSIEETTAQVEKGDQIEQEELVELADRSMAFYPPVYYANGHHTLAAVIVINDNHYNLELEDGSVWKVDGYDGTKALNWKLSDPLTITQNDRWFSSQKYKIINQKNRTSVETDLILGPIVGSEYSRFIVGIDQSRREVILNDNTHWQISRQDSSIFRSWALNDYIIIGTNTSFWDSEETLLINVNMNNTTRANQF